jgi:flagellar hook-associated protein 3 FlgL
MSLPSDDPSVMSQVLNLQNASSQNAQYQDNITQLQNSASTSYTAMNTLQSLISQANTLATNASNGTNTASLSTYLPDIKNLLQEAVSLGNTQDAQGNYIFGGTDTSKPPFVATTDSSDNITGVTYQGNDSVAKSDIGQNVTVSAATPGANTGTTGPRGLFTDSQSGADLFNHLISLQQNITSGNVAAIASTDKPALADDETNITYQIAANGVMQSALTSAANSADTQSTNLTTQISNATSANLATTLTQLTQTQTAYQAALESGTQVFNLSLLNYLQ